MDERIEELLALAIDPSTLVIGGVCQRVRAVHIKLCASRASWLVATAAWVRKNALVRCAANCGRAPG